jgi:hypothetical protein
MTEKTPDAKKGKKSGQTGKNPGHWHWATQDDVLASPGRIFHARHASTSSPPQAAAATAKSASAVSATASSEQMLQPSVVSSSSSLALALAETL